MEHFFGILPIFCIIVLNTTKRMIYLSLGGLGMMRNVCFKKVLIVGIIVLFLGVAIGPGINAELSLSKDTQTKVTDNELVDITVQVCRNDSTENYKTTLTRHQLEELDDLINNIRLELDNIETREDLVEIYLDAALSMDKLGLLPEDMSIEDAQQLLIDNTYNFENVDNKEIYIQKPGSSLINLFCYITGQASGCHFPIGGFIIPFRFYWWLCFGEGMIDPEGYFHRNPAEGWVNTIGLLGKQEIEGLFYGTLGEIPVIPFNCQEAWVYIGARGFTGFCIWLWGEGYETKIIGFATIVQLTHYSADSGDNVEIQPIYQKINLLNNYDTSQGCKPFFNLLYFTGHFPLLERLLNLI